MKKSMKDYKELTQKVYPVPERVQELIPVYRIAEDGIFELEKKPEDADRLFDKAYLFLDTNFATMDDYEKEDFLKLYCTVLNSMSVSFKIEIINNNWNMDRVRQDIFLHNRDGRFGEMVESLNRHIEDSMMKGRAGIEQVRLFIITCRRKNIEQARNYFVSVEANLAVNFDRMQSGLVPLDATERLRYLHAFYRQGQETKYDFDFKTAIRRGTDWRDIISPAVVKHYQDEYGTFDGITVQMDGTYVRALYVPQLPNSIEPGIIQKLMSGPYHVILTLDTAAIPKQAVKKRLIDLYVQNARAIEKQQQTRNKAMAWSSDITYERRRERDELENYMDIVNENDEKMFYLGIYAVISAGSKKQLENDVTAFCSMAEGEGFSFEPAIWEQIEAINTALPTGARFCSVIQPVFTQPLCALTPFVVQELYQPGGLFYGINQVSKNVLIGDRKLLKNGNGFILGITGGGKSVETKMEIIQVYLHTTDDIIIIDPQNEYRDIVDYLGGTFIDFGAESGHYINPLDTGTYEYMESKRKFIADKTELMLAIFSQILEYEISAQDKSLIGRCVREVFADMDDKTGRKKRQPPTLVEYYECMKRQREPQAAQLALALELFVSGSLDMFARQTNVDTRARLTAYGMENLGKEQSATGITVMLEGIRSRIAENAAKGRATRLYVEEFHNLAGDPYSANILEKRWKEVRKMGGLCTGITQNIRDLTQSKAIETMLCNSEYLSLLCQSDIEIDIFRRIFGISENLLAYLKNAESGCGLLKFGDRYIPKDGRIPKDSEMYRLFNTNFHEIQAQKRKKQRTGSLQKQVDALPELVLSEAEAHPTEAEQIYQRKG